MIYRYIDVFDVLKGVKQFGMHSLLGGWTVDAGSCVVDKKHTYCKNWLDLIKFLHTVIKNSYSF
jgi:hypothetical protein